jgi:hypothetical protein
VSFLRPIHRPATVENMRGIAFGRPEGHIGGSLAWYCSDLGKGSPQCARGSLGQFNPGIYGGGHDAAVSVPGPGGPMMGPFGVLPASMPASLFPTAVKQGDVVQVGGPFQGAFQGQVVVRFAGAPGQAIELLSPYGGSVVVPPSARSGACTVELNGRTIFSTNCVVGSSDAAHAPQHRGAAAWREFSTFGPMSGVDAGELAKSAGWAAVSGAFGYRFPYAGLSRWQAAAVSAVTALGLQVALSSLREPRKVTAEDMIARMTASGVKVAPAGIGVTEHRAGESKYATIAEYARSSAPPRAAPRPASLLERPGVTRGVPIALLAASGAALGLWLYLRRRRKVR